MPRSQNLQHPPKQPSPTSSRLKPLQRSAALPSAAPYRRHIERAAWGGKRRLDRWTPSGWIAPLPDLRPEPQKWPIVTQQQPLCVLVRSRGPSILSSRAPMTKHRLRAPCMRPGSASGSLVRLGGAKHGAFIEVAAGEHQADRKPAGAVHGHNQARQCARGPPARGDSARTL